MDTKEADVLACILQNRDETLTTHRLLDEVDLSRAELREVLDRLEEHLLIYTGAKTPQGHYYDINPTPRAEQALNDGTLKPPEPGIGPDMLPTPAPRNA